MKILRLRRSCGSGWNIHIEKSLVLLVDKVNYWYQGQLFGSGTWTSISGSICPSLTLLSTETKFKYQPEEKETDVVEELGLYSLMMSTWRRQRGRTRSQLSDVVRPSSFDQWSRRWGYTRSRKNSPESRLKPSIWLHPCIEQLEIWFWTDRDMITKLLGRTVWVENHGGHCPFSRGDSMTQPPSTFPISHHWSYYHRIVEAVREYSLALWHHSMLLCQISQHNTMRWECVGIYMKFACEYQSVNPNVSFANSSIPLSEGSWFYLCSYAASLKLVMYNVTCNQHPHH